MSTWGRMLFFNSEKNQILDLGLEQENMKNKMKKKKILLEQLRKNPKQLNIVILKTAA